MSRIASCVSALSRRHFGTLSAFIVCFALLLSVWATPVWASAVPAADGRTVADVDVETAPITAPAALTSSMPNHELSAELSAADETGLEDESASALPQNAVQNASAIAPAVAAQGLPHDLSPRGMFMAADWVVKAVMIGLLFASLVTWTVWVVKTLELRSSLKALAAPLVSLSKAASLTDVLPEMKRAGPMLSALTDATVDEMMHSKGLPVDGIKERVAMRLQRIEAAIGRKLNRGTGVLATIGSTAPFVGLFGTVWGIMNAFIGISKAQTTNLSVVAPGIAEALLATALGLVAAIPAVMIYNVFVRGLMEYRGRLADLTTEIQRVNARDLDREFVAESGVNTVKAA